MKKQSKIFIAGHRGLVGSALVRRLQSAGYTQLLLRTHKELDLTIESAVTTFFQTERPESVFLAAAKVGGIHANAAYPADFILTNLKIQTNIIEAAWRHGVKGLIFLGSSCIYPKIAPQPLKEEYLLTGSLEPTNEPYAVAKIAGIKLCESLNRQYGTRFISVMPTNLYGPNDNYDLENSHVLPALIRKFHLAKLASEGNREAILADETHFGRIPEPYRSQLLNATGAVSVSLWGTGSPRREFLYADDAADACVFLMERLDSLFNSANGTPCPSLFNIGCGEDLPIADLAKIIAAITGYSGPIEWDSNKPDGTPQKLLDVGILSSLGWQPKVSLRSGITSAYADYLKMRSILY